MKPAFHAMLLASILASSVNAATPATGIDIQRITFQSHGETLVGELYLPAGFDGRARPAVVVTGAWMTVKEQMPARYAREMAHRGFVALTFDFRGWGESDGARRQYEDPTGKIEDIKAAVAFLATRPEVAKDAIGGLGICASSGYMVAAAADTRAIKSIALVAPWLQDAKIVQQLYGGKQGVAKLQAAADAADAAYRASGKQSFVPAASLTDDRAIMFEVPYYTDSNRGMISAWRNEADPGFWRGWLSFDAMPSAQTLHQPFLMVHSEAAAIPQGAHMFYAKLAAPKKEHWLKDISQFDFYDQDAAVTTASDAVAGHFNATLGGLQASPASSASATGVPADNSYSPEYLANRARIVDVITSVAVFADQRRWDLVKAAFADPVVIDYTSSETAAAGNQAAQSMSPDKVVAAWQSQLPGYLHTQHLISNPIVHIDGDKAKVTSSIHATHFLPNDKGENYWVFVGTYEHELVRTPDGWRITLMRANKLFELGNVDLPKLAAARVAAGEIAAKP